MDTESRIPSMDDTAFWAEVGNAFAALVAGSVYEMHQSPILGRSSTLALAVERLSIKHGDQLREYPWTNIGYIGFPSTRLYVNALTPANRLIYLFLIECGRDAPSWADAGKLLLGISRAAEGDVLIPNANPNVFRDDCYGGFKQWQLLALLQQVHSAITGRPYTQQDSSFGLSKKLAALPLEPLINHRNMATVVAIINGIATHDPAQRLGAARMLIGRVAEAELAGKRKMTSPALTRQLPTPSTTSAAVKDVSDESNSNLTQGDYEVLAIVAYRQPVSKAIVDRVRGVPSDVELDLLVRLELIKTDSAVATRGPIQYLTTRRFLEVMGIHSLADLPNTQPPAT